MSTQGIVANYADPNHVPANIVQGVSIYGVVGTAQTGQPSGSGVPNQFFMFNGSEAMTLNNSPRIRCGTYETPSAIYFVVGAGTGRNISGGQATSFLTISKWDKGTGVVTTYRSGPTRTSVRSVGILVDSLTENAGVIQFAVAYDTPALSQHIEFDTATDTFWAFGPNVSTGIQKYGVASTTQAAITSTGNNFPTVVSGVQQGTPGAVTGVALTNSVIYSGNTYSTEVISHTSSGQGNGTEQTMMQVLPIALKS